MRKQTTLMTLAMLAMAFAPSAAADDRADVELTIESAERGSLVMTQEWTGEDARDFRQSLDAIFGDGTGSLTEEEAEEIRRAIEEDVRNQTLPMVEFDGSPAMIEDATAEFENVVGPVSSTEAIRVIHRLELSFEARDDANHSIMISPLRSGNVSITPPDGWAIEPPEGEALGAGDTWTTPVEAGEEIEATLVTQPDDAPLDVRDEVPALGVMGVIAAVAVALAFATRRRS